METVVAGKDGLEHQGGSVAVPPQSELLTDPLNKTERLHTTTNTVFIWLCSHWLLVQGKIMKKPYLTRLSAGFKFKH
ncbi:hypothetical protein [Zobellella sp. DQSA1]|uniref:hypothetical protein n=1 Tax=Zobellella sp. DQSA1 TaxID=3342386 RepID=UPI0035C169FF